MAGVSECASRSQRVDPREARALAKLESLPPGTTHHQLALVELASVKHDQDKLEEARELYVRALRPAAASSQPSPAKAPAASAAAARQNNARPTPEAAPRRSQAGSAVSDPPDAALRNLSISIEKKPGTSRSNSRRPDLARFDPASRYGKRSPESTPSNPPAGRSEQLPFASLGNAWQDAESSGADWTTLPQPINDDTVCGNACIDADRAGKSSGQSSMSYLDADDQIGAKINKNIAAVPKHASEPLPEIAGTYAHLGSAKDGGSRAAYDVDAAARLTSLEEVPLRGRHILEVMGVKPADGEVQLDDFLGAVYKCAIPPVLRLCHVQYLKQHRGKLKLSYQNQLGTYASESQQFHSTIDKHYKGLNSGLHRWADETHLLAVFASAEDAEVTLEKAPEIGRLWLKPYDQASMPCRRIAASELRPPTLRPKTSAVVAKRLISGVLHNREVLDLAGEQRMRADRKKKTDERQRRRQTLDAAWED